MTATAPTTAPAQATEVIQDAGHVAVRAPGSPASAPRTTCATSSPTEPSSSWTPRHNGRNLVDASVPGSALGQRPVHLRLPVQAVARPLIACGGRLPRLPRRGYRRVWPRPVHPLPAPGHRRACSTEDRRWTEVNRGDTGQRLRFANGFLWMCQGYYNH